jgi:DNA primase
LHPETRPSFYVNARKNLLFCHGCGCGGDLIRFVQLSQKVSFRQSVAYLQRQIPPVADAEVLEKAAAFYQLQLHRHPEAVQYLRQRGLLDPALIAELGIGYAPGGPRLCPVGCRSGLPGNILRRARQSACSGVSHNRPGPYKSRHAAVPGGAFRTWPLES